MKPGAAPADASPVDDADYLEDDEEARPNTSARCARVGARIPRLRRRVHAPHHRPAPQTVARLAAAFGADAAQSGVIREYGDAGPRGSPAAKRPPAVPRAQPSSSGMTPAERAAANKALFEAVKASRNALRAELARTREELEATRAELARHCGEALRTTQHLAALHAELATRQTLIDELRTRLGTAEARAELAAATAAASPRHPRNSAAAAMEAGAQAAEALRGQIEALQSDLILERARAGAAAASAAAALAESEAARLAEAAKCLHLSAPAAALRNGEPAERSGVLYPTEIMAMEISAASARCAALEARNAELEAAAAASAATAHQMTAELAMAAAMLDAQRGQIRAFMDASRAGSAVSLGAAEINMQVMDALTYTSTAPHAVTPGPSTPPNQPQAVSLPPAHSAQPRPATAAPHNSLAEPMPGEELPLPKPSGAAALLGCTSTRATTPKPAPASAANADGILASAQKLFGLYG